MNQLQIITQIVQEHSGQIRFEDPVDIKLPTGTFFCHAVELDPELGLWLMDGQGECHGPLKEDQVNAERVISSLYQRLKTLETVAA